METRPRQISISALSGGPDRWLRIPFGTTRPSETYVYQALAVAKENKTVPFYGSVKGVIVNYSPDCAVEFDLERIPVGSLPHAYSPGQAAIMHRGRALFPGQTNWSFDSDPRNDVASHHRGPQPACWPYGPCRRRTPSRTRSQDPHDGPQLAGWLDEPRELGERTLIVQDASSTPSPGTAVLLTLPGELHFSTVR